MKYPRLYHPSANSSMLRLIPARIEQQSDVPQFEMRLESTLAEIGVVPKLQGGNSIDFKNLLKNRPKMAPKGFLKRIECP